MSTQTHQQTYIPSKVLRTDYPLIDNDPHFKRVIAYARPSDYAAGTIAAATGPGLLYLMERLAPSHVGRGGFPRAMRLGTAVGTIGGFLYFYVRSTYRFYGMTENQREIDLDMKEMVAKVRAGEPLYGESKLTPHMQGVAARQGRYSALFMYGIPWFNFVNHNQHGVDTAKYFVEAERQLESERSGKAQDEVAKLL